MSRRIYEFCYYFRSIGGVDSIESLLCSILFNLSGSMITAIGKSIFKSFDSGTFADSKVITVAATVALSFLVSGAAPTGAVIGSSTLLVNPT